MYRQTPDQPPRRLLFYLFQNDCFRSMTALDKPVVPCDLHQTFWSTFATLNSGFMTRLTLPRSRLLPSSVPGSPQVTPQVLIAAAGAVDRESVYTRNTGIYGIVWVFGFSVIFLNFALCGSWEAWNSLKILSRDVGTFSTIGGFILRTLICWPFRPFSNIPPFSQLQSKKWPCHGSMFKPDPSRKMRDEIMCRKMSEILWVLSPRPNCDRNVVPKWLQHSSQSPVLAICIRVAFQNCIPNCNPSMKSQP